MNARLVSLKLGVTIAAGLYFLRCAWDPTSWHFIDGVNLIIHEAGHVVFSPFGDFLRIAGGSLFQVMVPAVFAGYFFFQGQPFSACLVLFWVGESLLNVSVYAGDAIAMNLPLLGGSEMIHDWNYLLTHLGALHATPQIAGTIRAIGTLLIIAATIGAIKNSYAYEQH